MPLFCKTTRWPHRDIQGFRFPRIRGSKHSNCQFGCVPCEPPASCLHLCHCHAADQATSKQANEKALMKSCESDLQPQESETSGKPIYIYIYKPATRSSFSKNRTATRFLSSTTRMICQGVDDIDPKILMDALGALAAISSQILTSQKLQA